jgi:hypothetical protein
VTPIHPASYTTLMTIPAADVSARICPVLLILDGNFAKVCRGG